jgi:hypothetical protein
MRSRLGGISSLLLMGLATINGSAAQNSPLGMSYKRRAGQKPQPSSAETPDDAGERSIRSVVKDVVEAVSRSRDAGCDNRF